MWLGLYKNHLIKNAKAWIKAVFRIRIGFNADPDPDREFDDLKLKKMYN